MGLISRLGITALVAGVVGGGLSGFAAITTPDQEANKAPEPRILSVSTIAAQQVTGYEVRRTFIGRVEARRESQVGFELGGLVAAILAEEGDVLEPGQVIAQLDTARYKVQLRQLRGRRTELQANIDLARATRNRQELLAKKGHSSQQRYDEARFSEQALHGKILQVEGEIASVQLSIKKSEIKAPFAAIVGTRFSDEGVVISAGVPVFDLLERSNPEVRIGLAGGAVEDIALGQLHTLNIKGQEIPARVRSILPVRDRGTRSVDVLFSLQSGDQRPNGIRYGDLARLDIAKEIELTGFWLPLTALTESSRGLWAVYVAVAKQENTDAKSSPQVDPDTENRKLQNTGVLERRELEVVHQEADRIFVRGTLGDQEQVVVGGLHRLMPGQRVRIQPVGKFPSADLLASNDLGNDQKNAPIREINQ
ncbi:efflux RND transporter periplasmic adaptor subunit [Kiloniella sp.]|uniref:efflux RND transporter periplasmic adaptor subunit n=1 Tax=Kiloniella sp. TaxID=1938587 RepID=UPI003B02990D